MQETVPDAEKGSHEEADADENTPDEERSLRSQRGSSTSIGRATTTSSQWDRDGEMDQTLQRTSSRTRNRTNYLGSYQFY